MNQEQLAANAPMSLRAYAKHRKALGLIGGTDTAVKKAIESRRIVNGVTADGQIIAEIADAEWGRNTGPRPRVRGRVAHSALCRACMEEGKVTLGLVTDHIVPISQGGERWDDANLQTLCRQPLATNEPEYEALSAIPPMELSGSARALWKDYFRRLGGVQVWTEPDGPGVGELCENRATLAELRKGLKGNLLTLEKQAKAKGLKIPGNTLTAFAKTVEGNRLLERMQKLNAQIIARERELGLTPSSRTRVQTLSGNRATLDPMERTLCSGEM